MGGTASNSALERNVARLFRQKTPMFAALEFTRSSILGGMLQAHQVKPYFGSAFPT